MNEQDGQRWGGQQPRFDPQTGQPIQPESQQGSQQGHAHSPSNPPPPPMHVAPHTPSHQPMHGPSHPPHGPSHPPQMMHYQGAPPSMAMLQQNLPQNQWMWYEANKKEMVVAYLLLIFIGTLGIHRFYLGKTGTGLAMCLLGGIGILTMCLYIGLIPWMVAAVWAFVDLFLTYGYVNEHNHRLLAQLQQQQPLPQGQPQQGYSY